MFETTGDNRRREGCRACRTHGVKNAVAACVDLANALTLVIAMIDKYDMYERQEHNVLLAIHSRHKQTFDECDLHFGDVTCIADDCELYTDVVYDTVEDLKHLGYVVEMKNGLLACTDKGWRRASEIIRENKEAHNNV